MKQLLILHGALGAKSQFTELKKLLSQHFEVYCIEFDGHGANHNYSGDYSIAHFADQTRATLRALGWEHPLVFGYSMGGYVALKLESEHSNSFEKIITLGTKFNWNPESAAQEVRMLDLEKIEEKVPAFAYFLKTLHGEAHWKSVVERTAKMMLEMGKTPPINEEILKNVSIPVTCLRGENDVMVNEEETRWAVEYLSNASFQQVESWKHPIDKVPTDDLVEKLLDLF